MKLNSTPAADGYYMPAEYAAQDKIWMIWPERPDNWRDDAVPAQQAYAAVARAISEFQRLSTKNAEVSFRLK